MGLLSISSGSSFKSVAQHGTRSPSEIDWADLGDLETDIAVGRYLANRHQVGYEYRGASRPGGLRCF